MSRFQHNFSQKDLIWNSINTVSIWFWTSEFCEVEIMLMNKGLSKKFSVWCLSDTVSKIKKIMLTNNLSTSEQPEYVCLHSLIYTLPVSVGHPRNCCDVSIQAYICTTLHLSWHKNEALTKHYNILVCLKVIIPIA
jgi:hypothetical protein